MSRDALEVSVERAILAVLKRERVTVRKDGKGGWPDRQVFLGNGRHFWLELKKLRGGRLTPAQARVIPMLRAMGDVVLVRPSLAEVMETVRTLSRSVP